MNEDSLLLAERNGRNFNFFCGFLAGAGFMVMILLLISTMSPLNPDQEPSKGNVAFEAARTVDPSVKFYIPVDSSLSVTRTTDLEIYPGVRDKAGNWKGGQ